MVIAAVAAVLLVALLDGGAVARTGSVGARADLMLTSGGGPVGSTVTGSQGVTASGCRTYRLRWDTRTGAILGTDSDGDGTGQVTFTVPVSPPGDHMVVATCAPMGSDVETVVGSAPFEVIVLAPTTTGPSSTSTVGPPTTPGLPTVPPSTNPTGTTASSSSPSSTAAPPVTAPATGAVLRELQECERNALQAQAHLVYQPERTMTVDKTYAVAAAVALDAASLGSVFIPGPEQTTIVPLARSRCIIQAQLTGAGFEISPPEPREQSFLEGPVLAWTWHVIPRQLGRQLELVLRLQAKILDDTTTRPGRDIDHYAMIKVDALRKPLPTTLVDWTSDFFGNGLVQFLLLPSGGVLTAWAIRHFRRRPTP
ncbi:MAG TPA: hypothetical protein VM942_04750 [Acidimicrobiales bacterium]|nr:hypothetical protein [Acidimicrobiales bacterium]